MDGQLKLRAGAECGGEAAAPLEFRGIYAQDYDRVLEIERAAFGPDAWAPNIFRFVLFQPRVVSLMVEQEGRAVGFVIYEAHPSHLQVLNLAVCPDCRRQGVAAAMLDQLKRQLQLYNRPRIVAEVRETNLPAQLFFRAAGFRCVQVLRDRYDGTEEDAYRFAYCVPAPGEGGASCR